MALPSRLELRAGTDRRLRFVLSAFWLLAFTSLLIHAQRMPGPVLMICVLLLLYSAPRFKSAKLKPERLQLHANGDMKGGDETGCWLATTWRSPWYTVIQVRIERQNRSICISANNNHPDDYRRLGIWCRYSPQQPSKQPFGDLPTL